MKLSLMAAALAAGLTVASWQAGAVTLNIGTDGEFEPFEFEDGNHNLIGLDMDLIRAMAEKGGYEVNIKKVSRADMYKMVKEGTLDAGISAISITPERKEQYLFSYPYYLSGLGVLVGPSAVNSVKTEQDLVGKVFCAQSDTTGEEYAKNEMKASKVLSYVHNEKSLNELAQGKCDAMVQDFPILFYHMRTKAPANQKLLRKHLSNDSYGILINKDKPEVQKIINDSLRTVRTDGTFYRIYLKWFGRRNKS